MTIALDYDKTYTEDPRLWNGFIGSANRLGHTVVMVTGRDSRGAMGQEVLDNIPNGLSVIFAGTQWKREAAVQAGLTVDVWIDDAPEYVGPQILIKGGVPK